MKILPPGVGSHAKFVPPRKVLVRSSLFFLFASQQAKIAVFKDKEGSFRSLLKLSACLSDCSLEANHCVTRLGYEADPAAADRLFNWLITAEKAAEIADVKAPLVILNTSATRIATNARIAPYSVIP